MKNSATLVWFAIVCVLTLASYGLQAQPAKGPCDTPEGKQFDFWVGEWELTWPAEQFGGKKGELGHGTNTIAKVLDE